MSRESRVFKAFQRMVVVLVILVLPRAFAGEEDPPLQATMHLKILSFDRQLKRPDSGELRLAVAYSPKNPVSVGAANEMASAFRSLAEHNRVTVHGRRLVVFQLSLDEFFAEQVRTKGIEVLYLPEGLVEYVPELIKLAQAEQIATLCTERTYLEFGTAVAVLGGDKHLVIVVNLPAAKAVGMALDPRLLQLAQVIR